MANKTNRTKQKNFLEALKMTMGVISQATEKTGISRQTVKNWRDKDEKFAEEFEEVKEWADDYIESHLFKLVEKLNPQVIMFMARTRLKHRGYAESQDFNVNDSRPVMWIEKIHPDVDDRKAS